MFGNTPPINSFIRDGTSVKMHDVVHCLGTSQSSEGREEYGDETFIKGSGFLDSGSLLSCNNAKSWQMGCYASHSYTYNGKCGWNVRLIGHVDYANVNDNSSSVVLKLDIVESIDYNVTFNHINSGTVQS